MKNLFVAASITAAAVSFASAQTTVGNTSTFASFNKIDGKSVAGAADLEYVLERGNAQINSQCILKAMVTNNTDNTLYVRVLNGGVTFKAPQHPNGATQKRMKAHSASATTIAPGATRQVERINPNLPTGKTPCIAQGHMNFRVSADEAEANRGGLDRSQRKGVRIR